MQVKAEWLVDAMVEAGPKLDQLSQSRISVEPGVPYEIPLSEVAEMVGGDEQVVIGVGMSIPSTPPLKFILLMDTPTGIRLAGAVVGDAAAEDRGMRDSVLQEMGNIVGSTIANTIATHLGAGLSTTIPEVQEDMAGAILATALSSMEHVADEVLVSKTGVILDEERVDCGIYLFTDQSGSEIDAETLSGSTGESNDL